MLILLYYYLLLVLTSRLFIVLLFLTRTHAILFNNDLLASTNLVKDYVNRHPIQLVYDDNNLFDTIFGLANMLLADFGGFDKFAISLGIPSREWPYHMEPSPLICSTNPLTCFYMFRDFSGGYSQAGCNFIFKISVNVTVDSFMNSSSNFSFSCLLKYLFRFRFMKLEKY